jgi:hypothetical protein
MTATSTNNLGGIVVRRSYDSSVEEKNDYPWRQGQQGKGREPLLRPDPQ